MSEYNDSLAQGTQGSDTFNSSQIGVHPDGGSTLTGSMPPLDTRTYVRYGYEDQLPLLQTGSEVRRHRMIPSMEEKQLPTVFEEKDMSSNRSVSSGASVQSIGTHAQFYGDVGQPQAGMTGNMELKDVNMDVEEPDRRLDPLNARWQANSTVPFGQERTPSQFQTTINSTHLNDLEEHTGALFQSFVSLADASRLSRQRLHEHLDEATRHLQSSNARVQDLEGRLDLYEQEIGSFLDLASNYLATTRANLLESMSGNDMVLARILDRFATLHTDVTNQKESEISHLRGQLNELNASSLREMGELRATVESSRNQAVAASIESDLMKQKLLTEQESHRNTQGQLNGYRRSVQDLERKVVGMQSTISEREQMLDVFKRSFEENKEANEELRGRNAQLLDAHQKMANELKTLTEEFKSKAGALEHFKEQLSHETRRVRELTEEKATLVAQVGQFADLRMQWNTREQELVQQLTAANQEIDKLQKAQQRNDQIIGEGRAFVQQLESQWQTANAMLEQKNAELQSANTTLAQQAGAVQAANVALQQQNADLQAANASLGSSHAELSGPLQKQNEELRTQWTKASEELQKLQTLHKTTQEGLNSKLHQAEIDRRLLEAELNAVRRVRPGDPPPAPTPPSGPPPPKNAGPSIIQYLLQDPVKRPSDLDTYRAQPITGREQLFSKQSAREHYDQKSYEFYFGRRNKRVKV